MILADLPHSTTPIQFLPHALVEPYTQRPSDPPFYLNAYDKVLRAEISDTEKKLLELTSMDENWDGYGALRISQKTISNARASLKNLLRMAPVPDITPNPNGTISLEWETERGVAHLEIGKTRFSFYLKPRSGKPVFDDGPAKQIPANIGEIVSVFLFPVQNAAGTMTKITVGFHVHAPA